MNFAPFNVLEFDGALPSISIASWLPMFTQPGLVIVRDPGTISLFVPVVSTVPVFGTVKVPDPWRATSSRTGPDPARGTAIRDPPGVVSAPPIISYVPPPMAPSNAGFSLRSVPDPRRGTSTPLYGPVNPFILTPFLSWVPTIVQPGRPVLRAPGTDHVKDVLRFPEAVSADKWQPTVIQPGRSIVRAKGTDSVLVREVVTADKWLSAPVQPTRKVSRAEGMSFVEPVWTVDTVADLAVCEGRLTLVSGQPLGNGSGTTLYFTPHRGNLIGFQQGQIIPFSETSIAIPVSTGVYDVFAYNNSGALALEFSSAWSTTGDGTGADGTRANAISLTNGIYYKSSDGTRRYLGTIYSSSGTSYDISGGIGTLGKRYVWNYYNRIRKYLITIESTFTWAYGTSSWRPFNNNANSLSSLKIVTGVAEESFESSVLSSANSRANPASTNQLAVAVGYDQNTTNSSSYAGSGVVNQQFEGYVLASYIVQENIGLHTFWALENALSGVTFDIYANGSGSEIHAIHWC